MASCSTAVHSPAMRCPASDARRESPRDTQFARVDSLRETKHGPSEDFVDRLKCANVREFQVEHNEVQSGKQNTCRGKMHTRYKSSRGNRARMLKCDWRHRHRLSMAPSCCNHPPVKTGFSAQRPKNPQYSMSRKLCGRREGLSRTVPRTSREANSPKLFD